MPVGSNSEALAMRGTARDDARLSAAIGDLIVPDEHRLDDRLRLAVRTELAGLVASLEADLRREGAQLLASRGEGAAAAALLDGVEAMPSLVRAGVLRDPELMDELVAEARAALITERLPPGYDDEDGDRPGLLMRLEVDHDIAIASAARALMASDSDGAASARRLPEGLHRRLTWWVAAAIRGETPGTATDRALAGAAERCLDDTDKGERTAALAARLAAALEPVAADLPRLLIDALHDRQLALFTALLARAVGVDGEVARVVVLDPDGDRLWAMLRWLDLDRPTIARIGWALGEADPRRDLESFADRLDAIAATDRTAAQAVLAPLSLPRDYREAVRAIGAGVA